MSNHKDTLKENLATTLQVQLLNLNVEEMKISGISAPPGCGVVEVKDARIEVRKIDNNNTTIHVKTPAGPRTFNVKFSEVY